MSAAASRPASPASRSRTATGDDGEPLFDFDACGRPHRAARAAIDAAGGDVLLVARCGVLPHRPSATAAGGDPPARRLRRGGRRLPLRARACARSRTSPRSSRRWRRSRSTCSPAISAASRSADLAALGVRRVSVGGALARMAWAGFDARGARDRGDRQLRRLRRGAVRAPNSTVCSRRSSGRDDRDRHHRRSADRRGRRRHAGRADQARSSSSGRFCRDREARHRSPRASRCGWRSRGTTVCGPIWATGRFSDEPSFLRWIEERTDAARSALPMPWSTTASDRAVGIVTLMEIRPAMRVIEMGNIVYTPAAAAHARRHRSAVPDGALRLRRARLPALRVEMQRAQRAVAAGGASGSASPSRASSAST